MINVEVKFKPIPNLSEKLVERCDKIIYEIASETLRQSESVIPMRTGAMRRSSMTAGVKGSNLNYYIGSYTNYASRVWNFPENTNWTTPGTNNQWFARTLKTHGATIINSAIDKGWKEVM